MRSKLILNHPWKQPPETWWYFSGHDDRALRSYAERLAEFAAPDPEDRRITALVLRDDDQENPRRNASLVGAWTAEGALKLADLLPATFADVRADITGHFADAS